MSLINSQPARASNLTETTSALKQLSNGLDGILQKYTSSKVKGLLDG